MIYKEGTIKELLPVVPISVYDILMRELKRRPYSINRKVTIHREGEGVTTVYTVEQHETPLADRLQRLTPRERGILDLLRWGKTETQIAKELGIAINTVKSNRANIFLKLEIEGRGALRRLFNV